MPIKKKVDARVRILIENAVKTRTRAFFVIVGDKGKDQVVNLHYMLSKCIVKTRPSVLWCYKKELGFSSNRTKRMKEIKKQQKKGLYDPNKDDPFELFLTATNIRFTYYSETQNILGNTFGMCVLQDFEAITPNVMARTIETVEGGGMVVLLLKTMTSLKQLFTMTMDVHDRFRTEAHNDVVGRFNERFLLSLASCPSCLVMDDEFNILPLSSHCLTLTAVQLPDDSSNVLVTKEETELKELQDSLRDTQPIGSLMNVAKTLDQGKALVRFVEAISEKTLRKTVSLTAARGRGKSAAMGLAIAAAVAFGYSNIFVTSPSPENLKTLFEFVFKGFDALELHEHTDYELVQSTNPAFNKAIIRVNIFHTHRQTIQYIQPQDHLKLGQAELVVIDEAAAIPLPYVKALLGPYLVFLSSTINGYEGTGRSLSLKLLQQLRQNNTTSATGRQLVELELKTPIRYATGDTVESWLNNLLCLYPPPSVPSSCPHPQTCNLYYVNRDTLFSYHQASELFLQRMMALYVSSHYKNSPNDLMLMSDAPAHHLFVLLGPVDETSNSLPDILCVIQVCMEGEISRDSVMNSIARGRRADGDLIPWTVSQQFQDNDFPSLSGVRVVRIATNPEHQRMGYGTRSLQLLSDYYEGKITNMSEALEAVGQENGKSEGQRNLSLKDEKIEPRKNLGPLLITLADRKPEPLHWMGVSYGLTQDLFNFWAKGGFLPVYLRLTQNETTGEHTCIMLKSVELDNMEVTCRPDWLPSFHKDFRKRFLSLLSYDFRTFPCEIGLTVLNPKKGSSENSAPSHFEKGLVRRDLEDLFSAYDLKRLESYSRNLIDYHVIVDMLPLIARLYFGGRIPLGLSVTQTAILLGLGLQHKSIDDMTVELTLPSNQVLALFNKAVRKISTHFHEIREKEIEQLEAPTAQAMDLKPVEKTLAEDLETPTSVNEKQQNLLKSLGASQYKIKAVEEDIEAALSGAKGVPSTLSIKRKAPKDAPEHAYKKNKNFKKKGHK